MAVSSRRRGRHSLVLRRLPQASVSASGFSPLARRFGALSSGSVRFEVAAACAAKRAYLAVAALLRLQAGPEALLRFTSKPRLHNRGGVLGMIDDVAGFHGPLATQAFRSGAHAWIVHPVVITVQ